MKYAKNILETIGNTPLVQLNSVTKEVDALVLAKVETFNPGNSVKDRMALKMVEDAEAEIPAKYWIKTDEKTKTESNKFKRQIRVALKAEGVHHHKALKMLWKIRCQNDPSNAQCGKTE